MYSAHASRLDLLLPRNWRILDAAAAWITAPS
jgi:hypothetical protein